MGHAGVGLRPAPADPEPQPAQAAAQREMLTVALLDISIPDRHIAIYDPACGTGGILSVAKEHLLDRAITPPRRANVDKFVSIHVQEMPPTNHVICQANLLIKDDRQAKANLGNSLIPHNPLNREPGDQFP